VKDTHVWSGLLLPLPVLLGLAARGLRLDLRRLARWDRLDLRWMRSLGRDRTAPPGKFNAGQKLFAAFAGAAGISMLVTGSIMRWYEPFPLAWRTGATFSHDWLGLALVVAVTGHIGKAVADPVALRSMFRGWVPASWAQRHRPRWYAELVGASASAPPDPTPAARAVDSLPRPTGRLVLGVLAVLLAVGVAAAAVLIGVGGGGADDPGTVAVRWEEAVIRQDYAALYDLAGTDQRGRSTRDQFVTVKTREMLDHADSKGRVVEVTIEEVDQDGELATVSLLLRERDGIQVSQPVGLIRENGDWKVAEYQLSSQGPPPA
jgi:formate dehydrogenase subunit gamma